MSKIQVNGLDITLSNKDFLAQGGEGAVYAKSGTAYKIYTDPSKMIPASKIKELSVLTMSNIIKPEDVIYSGKKAIGYTMKHIPHNISLCQYFTKAFKDRSGVTPQMSYDLVLKMQETVDHIHKNGILIVDLNEMNFLVDDKLENPFFIDVDSYQTPSYPATALMESVRDRHMKAGKFTKETDWFSFAIVSFQVFIGIHPYKGKHTTLKGFDERMINNISVFNSEVSIPKSCLPFDVIPSIWKDWYKAVFDNGIRCAPPKEGALVCDIVTVVAAISGSSNFVIKELFACPSEIVGFESNFGNDCIVCQNGFVGKSGKLIQHAMPSFICHYGASSFAATIENEKLKLFNIVMQTDVKISDINADSLMSTNGRVYIKQADKVLELEFFGSEHKPMVGAKVVGTVMEQATQMFSGVAIQSMLGTYFASVFPQSGVCFQYKMDALNGYKIVNARFENGILMVVAFKNGKYDKFIYSLDGKDIIDYRICNDVQSGTLNFTVLDNGICVSINDQDEVEVFSRNSLHKIKCVKDDVVNGGMRLCHDGNVVMFFSGKKMFSLKMK